MTATILLAKKASTAIITFNRPQHMNSFDYEMAVALAQITEEVYNDPSYRSVVLNGAGDIFMAGGDVNYFHDNLDNMPEKVLTLVRLLNSAVLNLQKMHKPVIASVHGAVAGAGISLMLAADYVLAAENTRFTLAYSSIGTTPDGGASFNLPRLVGTKKAMELLMFSDVFTAADALNWGMINRVVPAEQVNKTTEEIAQRFAQGPTLAYGRIKNLVNDSLGRSIEAQMEAEARCFNESTQTLDFHTGVTAFLNKNKPGFEGR